jgi:hypothetical protein
LFPFSQGLFYAQQAGLSLKILKLEVFLPSQKEALLEGFFFYHIFQELVQKLVIID